MGHNVKRFSLVEHKARHNVFMELNLTQSNRSKDPLKTAQTPNPVIVPMSLPSHARGALGNKIRTIPRLTAFPSAVSLSYSSNACWKANRDFLWR